MLLYLYIIYINCFVTYYNFAVSIVYIFASFHYGCPFCKHFITVNILNEVL